jgi:hypothetical protein
VRRMGKGKLRPVGSLGWHMERTPRRGRAGARPRRDVTTQSAPGTNCFAEHCLNLNNSRNLYRVHKTLNTKVVDLNTPLQLSQRSYGVFLNRFCERSLPTLNDNLCQRIGGTVIWESFSSFSTQNLKFQST